ncbi:ABC transporter permease DevC [Synechocystis sp. PCC 6714]|uniref:ABC transporter permease DevC n=1 Tax=Synechocystis sp. (strain PCC 6714) TaxID=1147 RepID=UPI000404DD5C|nr:ABC transporter permease DevC [Synechocystis sp. PCC 6714]AIE76063.1 ABC transporter permease protein [Synechocystis sp. PCC 6714]
MTIKFIPQNIPLAWLQLKREKGRLMVAMAGIAFADMLMFIQLGFQNALYDSNTQLHQTINADLVLISPQGRNIVSLDTFPRRRLYQALSFDGVTSAEPIYADFIDWKNPQTNLKTSVLVLGFDPQKPAFLIPEVEQNLEKLKMPDVLLFDRGSRGNYTTTITDLKQGKTVTTEARERKLNIKGLFLSGASFAADGNVITSDLNFHRIITSRNLSQVSAGFIQLKPGIDPQQMAEALRQNLPNDVKILTKAEFIDFEKTYWSENTSIGFIFTMGTAIGFVVGVVIVYQILSGDVAEHTAEYATLKAMGYRNSYLLVVVFQEALILAILGFLPGTAIAFGLYSLTRNATNLPLFMTLSRATTVLILTIFMCIISGGIATRKLRQADPADIF